MSLGDGEEALDHLATAALGEHLLPRLKNSPDVKSAAPRPAGGFLRVNQ